MTEIMSEYLLRIAHALLVALAGWLGIQVSALLKKYINTKIKQSVCRTAVQFVEQVFKDIHGPEKLAEAMAKASQILEEKGITISETELLVMLEAAVGEFNKAFSKDNSQGQHLPGVPVAEVTAEEPEPGPAPSVSEIIADLKDVE